MDSLSGTSQVSLVARKSVLAQALGRARELVELPQTEANVLGHRRIAESTVHRGEAREVALDEALGRSGAPRRDDAIDRGHHAPLGREVDGIVFAMGRGRSDMGFALGGGVGVFPQRT